MLHVFCYHRVVEEPVGYDRWGLGVTRARFEEHLQALSRRMTLLDLNRVSLEEALHAGDEYALISFDDIYHEVLTCALPVLESFGASALLFIAGAFLGEPCFWWDELEALYAHGCEADRNAAIDRTWQWLRDRTPDEKALALRHMARVRPGASVPSLCRPLSREELMAVAHHPSVRFGGHTMTHPWMPALDAAAMTAEIEAGTELLRRSTGQEPLAFAYPFGAWNGAARQAVAQSGYTVAFTTQRPSPYPAKVSALDLLAFPRLVVSNWSGNELDSKLN